MTDIRSRRSNAVIQQMSLKARESFRRFCLKAAKMHFQISFQLTSRPKQSIPGTKMKFLAAFLAAAIIATCVSLTSQSPVPQNSTALLDPSAMLSSSVNHLASSFMAIPSLLAAVPAVVVGTAAAVPSAFMSAVKPMLSF